MQSILLGTLIFSASSLVHSLPSGKDYGVQAQAIPKAFGSLPTNGSFWYLDMLDGVADNKYTYPEKAGEGVDIYVIDSGINVQHPVFGGRASLSQNFIPNEENIDLSGHGTFVGGVAAMVARKANIISIRALGTKDNTINKIPTSSLVEGLKFAVEEIKRKKKEGKSVINISSRLDDNIADSIAATEEARKAGIPVVVAAGNQRSDACDILPKAMEYVISVGSVEKNNALASYSNFGPCVDITTYGSSVRSAVGTADYGQRNGTSYAAPIVSGIAAILLSMGVTPSNLLDTIRSLSSVNTIVEPIPPNAADDPFLRIRPEHIALRESTTPRIATLQLIDSLKL
ncbi:peptidase S8/S53 domain-containing protein [Paraphysoderma sedebokerense]|nr:peptidase S8/S53 domain-containing protein [Paraphysoderma sedebokerense]